MILICMGRISIHEKGEYLASVILAAGDGVITTFSVVSAAKGASLVPKIVVVLGLANLFADGFSMAAGSFLGKKSEIEYESINDRSKNKEGTPLNHGILTFVSFDLAGSIPLLPFLLLNSQHFIISSLLVGVSLFVIGFLKGIYTGKDLIKGSVEMLSIGGFAAIIAFMTGFLIDKYIF